MMKNILLFLAFATVGAGLAYGQAAQERPFTLKIAADMPFKAGADMFIRITETNTSNHVVSCTRNDMNFHSDVTFSYDVQDDHGRPVQMRSDAYGWPMSIRHCALPPGKSHSGEHLISWLFQLVPGRYTIQVSRRADDGGGSVGRIVTSNEISFEVAE
jgi:hypothetical protein